MKLLIKVLCCLLTVITAFSVITVTAKAPETLDIVPEIMGVTDETEDTYLIKYEKITENDNLILYADTKRGHFALKNKATGYLWYSTPNDVLTDETTIGLEKWNTHSQIVVEYVYKEDVLSASGVNTLSSQLGVVESGNAEVKKSDNGIRVDYFFQEIDTLIPVEYFIDGDEFSASIKLSEIKEGKEIYITAINLLPYFGAGNSNESGKLLIPDGSGALIDFNNGIETSVYRKMIYGDNVDSVADVDNTKSEVIRMPVFAVIKENNTLMGVITKGDSSASIRAVNGNDSRKYNCVSSICELRSLQKMVMFKNSSNRREIGSITKWPENADCFEVTYKFLDGDNANYVGVAKEYRNYLIEEKGLTKSETTPSFSLDIYGAIDVEATFLGVQYSKLKSLTTFSQAEEILDELKAEGVENVSVRYLGWSNYGLLNKKLPKKAKALSKLGGNSGFKELLDYTAENDGILYADVDLLRFRSGSKKTVVKNIFNEVAKHTERLRSVYAMKLNIDPFMYLSPDKISEVSDNYLKSLKKQGITDISFSTLGSYCYSNNGKKNTFHRYFFALEIEKTLKNYKDNDFNIALDDANAYAAVYADRIYNTPVLTSGCSIFDEEIPFYQIVLHGYTAMTVESTTAAQEYKVNILKAVESGSELLYSAMYEDSSVLTNTRYDLYYSTNYKLWIDEASEIAVRYYDLLRKIHDKEIVSHRTLQENVCETVFQNGIKVIVNYNEDAVTINGKTIEGLNYITEEGAEE
ncbi:MAG: hypothetical protein IKD04_06790 [Clostridia bacterium]|nr:hypothetical protein [Clostridia bacterium]